MATNLGNKYTAQHFWHDWNVLLRAAYAPVYESLAQPKDVDIWADDKVANAATFIQISRGVGQGPATPHRTEATGARKSSASPAVSASSRATPAPPANRSSGSSSRRWQRTDPPSAAATDLAAFLQRHSADPC